MRIVVLGSPTGWYAEDLVRAAAGTEFDVECIPFRDVSGGIGAAGEWVRAGTALAPDAILVRTMPPGTLEQVVFRMDCLARWEAAGTLVVNPAKTIETAVDKYLTTARLAAAGLPVPQTVACQSVPAALAAFAELGGDVVVKPLFGSEGRGILRVSDEDLAARTFHAITRLGAVCYVQPYLPHEGCDLRLLVLGEKVLGMRRINHADWRTNLSRGGQAEPLEVTPELGQLARQAAAAVGAVFAGVDVLPGSDGRLHVLEVNAVPGWKGLAEVLQTDIAASVLELLRNLHSTHLRSAPDESTPREVIR